MVFKKIKFIVVFALLLLGRLLISGKGMLDDPDEYVYHLMLYHLEALYNFDLYYWCKATFNIHLFPVELFIRLIQTKFTAVYANYLGLPLDHTQVMIIPNLFNIAVSLLNIFILYKILRRLQFSSAIALLGILIYGTFLTTNIYTRHFLPYENSYCFHLLALYLILLNPKSIKHISWAGFFAACGHASYFGFFMMFFVNGVFLFFYSFSSNLKKAVLRVFLFMVPVAIYIIGFDMISRVYFGDSYIAYTLRFSETIYQGSYDEGLIFAFIHTFLIEKWWGLLVLCTSIVGMGMLLYSPFTNKKLKTVVAVFLLAYFAFGLNAVLFEGMVFYARVFRMYYLPILIGFLFLIQQMNIQNSKSIFLNYTIVFIALINYIFVINDLNSLGYPRTEIQQNGFVANEQQGVAVENKHELICALEYKKDDRFVGITESKLPTGKYIFLNFCFFYHDGDLSEVYTPVQFEEADVIYHKKHFMSHPSYTLEYCSREGRKVFFGKSYIFNHNKK